MKTIWAMVLTVALITTCGVVAADESSAQPEFPSVGEILDTFEWPDYSWDRFVSDTQTVFSESMFRQMGEYGGDLIQYVAEDTFLADLGSGDLSESFDSAHYLNFLVLACFVIAIICVLGALISWGLNRHTFGMSRDD